jgi:hypothetical protein
MIEESEKEIEIHPESPTLHNNFGAFIGTHVGVNDKRCLLFSLHEFFLLFYYQQQLTQQMISLSNRRLSLTMRLESKENRVKLCERRDEPPVF